MEPTFIEWTWGETVVIVAGYCLVYVAIPCVILFLIVKAIDRRAQKSEDDNDA